MLTPTSEAELAETIAAADGPLAIRGGGTRGLAPEGAPLSLEGLRGIALHEPGALTLVAAAGTPLAEVEAALAAENQRLPFEPMDHRTLLGTTGEPTIGGVVAAGVSGPRRVQAGACRDALIGARFVDGRGRVVKSGGRVMKNVTGYDLARLMCGAHGTLGVLTEVAFKVLPAPEATGVLLIEGLDDATALAALSAALASPWEVTGAAHTPKGLDGAPVTMVRVEGFSPSVAYRLERLSALLAPFGGTLGTETDPERTAAGWAWVRDAVPLAGAEGDLWRISVRPSRGAEAVARISPRAWLYDWGGGLVWAVTAPGTDVRGALAGLGGHASCLRGAAPRFAPEPAPVAALAAGLRAKFDPRGLLNPGLMG